jgi:uncharacterized protein YcbX
VKSTKKINQIAFADKAAYMAFSLGSVEDLNAHLRAKGEQPVDARNFRPNIVVSGLPAFDEVFFKFLIKNN